MGLNLIRVQADQSVQDNFDEIARQWPAEPVFRGSGDPNGNVTAAPGGLYVNRANGRLWVHEDSVSSNTNWVLK